MKGTRRLQAIQDRIQRGDLDGAIEEYEKAIEGEPDDWTSVTALGDLYIQKGDIESGVAHLSRAADHLLNEGFYAKASALYRRVLKLVEDDHALLSLVDIAARQGLLAEARQHLVVLERQRRARGDDEGADECLASLEAIVDAQHRIDAASIADFRDPIPLVTRVDERPDPPQSNESPEPSEPSPIEMTPVEPVAERFAPVEPEEPHTEVAEAPVPDPGLTPQQEAMSSVGRMRARSLRGRAGGATRKRRSLGDVFKQMRAEVEQEADAAACHERFDLAQYYLQEGDEAAAISALEEAARAPMLRFVAGAQLGRLHVSRGHLASGIEWLERASQAPPVSPDEGLAVLYELADALERTGEVERALTVFMQLVAQRRAFRDVQARVAELSRRLEQGGA